MQDCIVAWQLYGICGVAEVTAFGGISKQYEVAVNPVQLKAMNLTTPEIFEALEKNNGEKEVVGGVVLMLKGSNSAELVAEVKERMPTIQKSLPADVEIEAFLTGRI